MANTGHGMAPGTCPDMAPVSASYVLSSAPQCRFLCTGNYILHLTYVSPPAASSLFACLLCWPVSPGRLAWLPTASGPSHPTPGPQKESGHSWLPGVSSPHFKPCQCALPGGLPRCYAHPNPVYCVLWCSAPSPVLIIVYYAASAWDVCRHPRGTPGTVPLLLLCCHHLTRPPATTLMPGPSCHHRVGYKQSCSGQCWAVHCRGRNRQCHTTR